VDRVDVTSSIPVDEDDFTAGDIQVLQQL
jgi:hypothetical protein